MTLLRIFILFFIFCSPVGASEVSSEIKPSDIVEIIEQSLFDEAENVETLPKKIKFLFSKQGASQTAQNFKLHETYLKIMRTSRSYSHDQEIKNHIYNLGMILPFTELSEILAGPIFYSTSSSMSAPDWVTHSGSAVASLLALPGVDPICFLAITVYFIKPVQKGVTKAREWVAKTIFMPIKQNTVDKVFKKQLALGVITQKLMSLASANNFNFVFKRLSMGQYEVILSNVVDNKKTIQFGFSKSGSQLFLKSLQTSGYASFTKTDLFKKLTKIFGMDARLALKEYAKKQSQSQYLNKAYIKKSSPHFVEFTEGTILLPQKAISICQKSLSRR